MKKIALFLCLFAALMAVSCNKEQTDIRTKHERAVVILPKRSSEVVFDLKAVTIFPYVSFEDREFGELFYFYESFPENRKDRHIRAEVFLLTTLPKEGIISGIIDYDNLPQYIHEISIWSLDESLGLGRNLRIPMERGEYKGGNDLIETVIINSFKMPTSVDNEVQLDDCNFNIYIKAKSGTIISIRYINWHLDREIEGGILI